jgi:hypothetical protein
MSHKHKPHGQPAPAPSAYTNGMADNVNGFVTLQAAEEARAKALASGNAGQVAWAGYFPTKWAIGDAANEPALNLSDADKFSNSVNLGFAHAFWSFAPGTDLVCWCPQAFVATKPDSADNPENKAFVQGPTLPGYASFSERVSVKDVAAIFADSLARAAT